MKTDMLCVVLPSLFEAEIVSGGVQSFLNQLMYVSTHFRLVQFRDRSQLVYKIVFQGGVETSRVQLHGGSINSFQVFRDWKGVTRGGGGVAPLPKEKEKKERKKEKREKKWRKERKKDGNYE